ncbi:MAG: gliding motility-associated C-terminal domain-containing protein, partial [Bacteroidota bacterium]
GDAPATIEVCFRAFENDGLFGCDIFPTCTETICNTYALPALNGTETHTLELPAGGDSGGNVSFEIAYNGFPDPVNDLPCDAIDLGVLNLGGAIGDATVGDYYNFCATNTGEPEPNDEGAFWYNNLAVWFQFTTGPDPLPYADILVTSDPSGYGNPVSAQLALYTSSDNSCTGTFTMLEAVYDDSSFDELLPGRCLEPNTTYFLLVDGVNDTQEQLTGFFGVEINAFDATAAGDFRCTAEDFGVVPEGGSVGTNGFVTNACATGIGDPFISTFLVQQSVWFEFTPPSSGHVIIEAISETTFDPINLQMAVFSSTSNTCTGFFQEIEAVFTPGDFDETIELSCLDPNDSFWIIIDGDGANLEGSFTITVTDAGDDTPITDQTVTLCAGETLEVGSSVYSTTGMYQDIINLPNGCDSIVNTDLTVLDPLQANIEIILPATGPGIANGVAQSNTTGGQGPYFYLWDDFTVLPSNNTLEGEEVHCLTIIDANDCQLDTCFTMPSNPNIVASATVTNVACNGGTSGLVELTVNGGNEPYDYTWNNADNSLNGGGNIATAGLITPIAGLPAGDYTILIEDGSLDTTLQVVITEPSPIDIQLIDSENASCFSVCDGSLAVAASGGTPPFAYTWGAIADSVFTGLCAGAYTVTVTDGNNCTQTATFSIDEPAEFIAEISVSKPISCFGGSDGTIEVSTNGTPTDYIWSVTGETGIAVAGLGTGTYSVTVTNQDGCEDIATIFLDQPSEPLSVSIVENEAIACNGDENAILEAVVSGPGNSISYTWSNGQNGSFASDLGSGTFTVTVINENGCEATANYAVLEPAPIEIFASANEITCLVASDAGIITIDSIAGGVEPYVYSADGGIFTADEELTGLFAGLYELQVQDAAGCIATQPIEVIGPDELIVDLGLPQTVNLGENVEISALGNSPDLVYAWAGTVGETFDCLNEDCSTVAFVPLESGVFVATALDTVTSCIGVGQVEITVNEIRSVYMANAFSPNFDGINDVIVPFSAPSVLQINTFRVFDRFGAMLYEARNFAPGDESFGWDGTFRGQLSQTGVYAYFAEVEYIDGEREIFKGDILLVR